MNTKKLNGSDSERKWCPVCRTLKSRTLFSKCKTRYDGLQSRCTSCCGDVYVKRKDKHLAICLKWAKNNKEKMLGYAKKWRERHPARVKQNQADFAKRYSEKFAQKSASRRGVSAKSTPGWANKFFIEEAYALAKLRTKVSEFQWHVDHIVPLQSPLVCGLHVENNLRVITAIENLRKQNHYWPDMP